MTLQPMRSVTVLNVNQAISVSQAAQSQILCPRVTVAVLFQTQVENVLGNSCVRKVQQSQFLARSGNIKMLTSNPCVSHVKMETTVKTESCDLVEKVTTAIMTLALNLTYQLHVRSERIIINLGRKIAVFALLVQPDIIVQNTVSDPERNSSALLDSNVLEELLKQDQ